MQTAGTATGIHVAVTDRESGAELTSGSITGDFTDSGANDADYRGSKVVITLDEPLEVQAGQAYGLSIRIDGADAKGAGERQPNRPKKLTGMIPCRCTCTDSIPLTPSRVFTNPT